MRVLSFSLALLGLACSERGAPVVAAPPAPVPGAPAVPVPMLVPAPDPAAPKIAPRAVPEPPDHEQADLDADNDADVAPPAPIERCPERLAHAGVSFRPAELPLTGGVRGRFTCGAEQVVTYLRGPAKVAYNAAPTLTCRLALALARFEQIVEEQASLHLGRRVVRFTQMGTYSCRKMVRFDFVSEHSYANAIDIKEFVLDNGERVSVKKYFGPLGAPPQNRYSTFLRSVAERAFDERLFSVVLTPYWDELHGDHFHLDLARYRVDGTRPAPE